MLIINVILRLDEKLFYSKKTKTSVKKQISFKFTYIYECLKIHQ